MHSHCPITANILNLLVCPRDRITAAERFCALMYVTAFMVVNCLEDTLLANSDTRKVLGSNSNSYMKCQYCSDFLNDEYYFMESHRIQVTLLKQPVWVSSKSKLLSEKRAFEKVTAAGCYCLKRCAVG